MTKTWIGPFDFENFSVGHKSFLIEHHHNLKGWTRYELRDTPAQTNQSYADRLDGWCGTNNDVATYAKGAVEVVKIAKNGRIQVQRMQGGALTAYLDDAGYPELAP